MQRYLTISQKEQQYTQMIFRKIFNKDTGFTLLEVVSMLIIIAACFTLFRVVYNYRDDTIKTNIANEELALLNCAIEIYKSENGTYPICESQSVEENAKRLYGNIASNISSFAEKHQWKIADNKILDPWGTPYVYKCTPDNSISYILFSMGPNGFIDENEIIDDMYSR